MTATDITLGDFEGRDIASVSIVVNKAGDGLSAPMDIAPRIIHQGQRGKIVIEYECTKIRFDPIKDTEDVKRVQILDAIRATFFDNDAADKALAAQDELIEEARRRREDGVDDRQLKLGDDDGRGGEPQTVGQIAEDVVDIAGQLEDSADRVNARTKALHRLAKRDGKDALVAIADDYGLTTYGRTIAELVDAVVDHEQSEGLLPATEDEEGDNAPF